MGSRLRLAVWRIAITSLPEQAPLDDSAALRHVPSGRRTPASNPSTRASSSRPEGSAGAPCSPELPEPGERFPGAPQVATSPPGVPHVRPGIPLNPRAPGVLARNPLGDEDRQLGQLQGPIRAFLPGSCRTRAHRAPNSDTPPPPRPGAAGSPPRDAPAVPISLVPALGPPPLAGRF